MSDLTGLDGSPTSPSRGHLALLVVGVLEAASLLALLVNLATIDNPHLAQAIGPLHGLLWLSGIALAWNSTTSTRVRVIAVIPVVGALWAARRIGLTSLHRTTFAP